LFELRYTSLFVIETIVELASYICNYGIFFPG
jgi:hypothetical protein